MPAMYGSAAALGRLCQAGCGTKVPKALNDAGIETHPCCGPSELKLANVNHSTIVHGA